MHLQRWLTSIVALPFLIFFIYKGGAFLFAIFICLVSIISLWEYFRIVFNDATIPPPGIILFLAYITGSGIIFASFYRLFNVVSSLIAVNLIILSLISIIYFKKDEFILEAVAKQIKGVVYIPLFLSYLVIIRSGENGILSIFLILVLIILGDTGAFYAGTCFGRHKLAPVVSPGKTIEGSIGGLGATLLGGIFFRYYFMPQLNLGMAIIFFLCIGIAGQAGDLFESLFKRRAGVKDSGNILPGHGGILDRIDALLFASPVAYVFMEYLF
ncbi:MAG TPA: phosphatidate cytidylyltransferase [Desulfobacteraceae bacterium]|nr:phosphatidate cytidylyltransferase [Desulfobacteraceae bacterium]